MFGAINYYLAGGGVAACVPFGCATYTTAGSYTFTVPAGVSKISVVCVGAGARDSFWQCSDTNFVAGGGSGGALTYTNCIPVTSGESLTVVVGAGAVCQSVIYCENCGCCSFYVSGPGGPSYISRGASVLIRAQGGYIPNTYGSPWPPTPDGNVGSVSYLGGQSVVLVSYTGTTPGGSGAAGYAGNGGQGGGVSSSGNAGSGGGGGGGSGAPIASPGVNNKTSASGGGVGLLGQGPSGAGGTYSPIAPGRLGGGGGSGGTAGNNGSPNAPGAGLYGGGGGRFVLGARGGVRIIYGGTGKSYPSNAT